MVDRSDTQGDGRGQHGGPALCEAAALDYLSRGWSVVPVQPRAKRPLIRWTEFQTRRADRAEIQTWYRRWPDANVAIVTGALSGLVVLDVDPAHGGDASLHGIERQAGPMDPTLESSTGGGGRHLYFRHPGPDTPNRVGLQPGLDLRGDGGVIVAPPSIHPSGRPYRWREGRGPDALAPAPMPPWLRDAAAPDSAHPGHPPAHWRALVSGGISEGARNTSIASLAGHLLWRSVDPEVVLELLLCWNRVRCLPALPDDEVAATVASVVRSRIRRGAAA